MILFGAKSYVRTGGRAYSSSSEMSEEEPAPHGTITVRTFVVCYRFYAVYSQVSHGFFDRLERHVA